jgi:hypothetical protein
MALLFASGNAKPQYPYDMWYGIEGDSTSNDYLLKRIGNMDLHRTCPIQNRLRRFVENADGSVKYYLHQNDSRLKEGGAAALLDSTDGNVMLEKPAYYFRYEIEGTKWRRAYSEYPLPGFIEMPRLTVSPWYATVDSTTNTAVSGCWLTWSGNELARDANGYIVLTSNAAQFRGGNGTSDASYDGTYRSQLGMPRTSIPKSTVRSWCKNGTHHGVYRVYNEIAWLQRLEYASLNCQSAYTETLTADGFRQGGLGSGPVVDDGQWNTWAGYRPFIPSGVTAVLGNNTGKVSYLIKGWTGGDKTVQLTSYRGLEAPFEYLWLLADDILARNDSATNTGKSTIYLCEDITKFTSHSDATTTIPNGYVAIANIPRNDGYILQLTHSLKGYSFPEKVGGSANTGTCDYFWTSIDDSASNTGWFGCLLSARATPGANAGFGCLYTYNRSSYSAASIGFRLCRY